MKLFNLVGVAFLMMVFVNTSLAQLPENYTSYNKTKIFSESFIDNSNDWRIFYTKVKKGRYVVETIGKDQPAVATIPIQIDKIKNYQIETKITIEWNRTEELMGIVWNRDLNNGYYLGFNKFLETMAFVKNYEEIKPLRKAESLGVLNPKFVPNDIAIRKVDDHFYIFINKIFVYKMPAEEDFGDHVGYFVGKGSEIRAFELEVFYLD